MAVFIWFPAALEPTGYFNEEQTAYLQTALLQRIGVADLDTNRSAGLHLPSGSVPWGTATKKESSLPAAGLTC